MSLERSGCKRSTHPHGRNSSLVGGRYSSTPYEAIPVTGILVGMMWLTDVGTGIITAILAAGGYLTAPFIEPLPPAPTPAADTLATVPRTDSADAIPHILLRNAAYQQAAVVGSQGVITGTAASNPTDALVNVFCTYRTDERIRYTTGSGVFISPAGVILTNAHVAQFLLLETVSDTGTTECVVRHGDPATPAYQAELLYISPLWIRQHAALINDAAPKGTGERDFALLYLTDGVDSSPLPARLPFLNVDTALQSKDRIGDTVTIAGYPTEDTGALLEGGALRSQTATTSLVDLYTFGTNYGDLYFLGGSTVGMQGMSGGPVIADGDTAIGLIVTKGDDTIQGSGSLNAITLSYVDRAITEETGLSLSGMLAGNISYRAYLFQQTIVPYLASLLAQEL